MYKVTNNLRLHFKTLHSLAKSSKQIHTLISPHKSPNPNPCGISMENESNSSHETSSQPLQSLSISSPPQMSLKERFDLIRSIGEECIQEDELERLLANKTQPIICYDGFEPSGRMHIAQGVMKAINVNKLTSSGCKVKIWIADWFALMNNKMGGDLKKIQVIGNYLIEIWKAVGMNIDGGQVEFLWSSEEINSRAEEYWPLVMDIAMRNKLPRILRCCQIMGRSEQDELSGAQIFYPCMQCADIFFLKADICQLGMDQRKVNVLAREYCDDIKRKNKPIILSHHMLPGLQEGQEKMSKSDPSSSIYMEDEEAEVNLKIKKAFCPPKVVEKNPCLEYIKYIVFPWFNEFTVERKPDNGGDKTFKSFKDLANDYESGELHPGDLKPALAKALNRILQPVRDHFNSDPKAKDLLKRVKSYKVTNNLRLHSKTLHSLEKSSKQIHSLISPHRSPNPNPCGISMENESNSSHETSPSQPLQSLSISPPPQMSLKERFDLVRSIGEECIQEDELERLLANKPQPICYDGFEPSGRMHIAQGVMKAINVNKLTSSGCKVKIWIADWFAQLNNKMGGDLKKIQVIGNYLIEIWKAVGMNIDGGQVEFLWSSEEINSRADEYWPLVMDIARRNKLPRILRCCQIMGRSEQDELSAAQIFYPCMQCADIFFLKADICQLGMDQRKVNVLAREYCDDIKRKNKPIILSHHMLPGLQEGQEKMSKSDPSSSIYMEDEEAEVNLKIKKAFCPPKVVAKNPCLEYIKYIVFPWFNELTVERKPDNGGDKTFKSFKDLANDYESGELHPGDLKPALAKALNRILQPVRDHFNSDPKAKDLLKRVKSYKVTR